MNRRIALVVLFVALRSGIAQSQQLPPVDPILPGSDHTDEDHTGHDHSFQDLHDVDFMHGNLTGTNFTDSNLADVNFRDARLVDADFVDADLSRAILRSEFDGADFTRATMTGSRLNGSTSTGVIFVDADLRGSFHDDVFLYNSDFRNANFAGAALFEFSGVDSDFRGAVFQDGVFGAAGFGITNFHGSDLRGVDFGNLDVPHTNFSDADFRGANLRGTNFLPAYDSPFEGALFDATTIYDSATVFPPGFDPVAAGLTLVPEPSTFALAALAAPVLLLLKLRRQ
jgi:uncharacterized protein YjbI with pentapeptide repeats